jgi:hypothetical protein
LLKNIQKRLQMLSLYDNIKSQKETGFRKLNMVFRNRFPKLKEIGMSDYYFKNNKFIIYDYDKKKPFSSFLPGIAGLYGIPLWAFYVNRGQGIASFGYRDKNGAILEFFPANSSYQYIDRIGFRTFIKEENKVYEIFKPDSVNNERRMEISENEFSVIEINHELNIEVSVTYFILTNENFGGLVRKVEIKDLRNKTRNFEVLDGLASLLPSGIDYGGYKAVSNLLRSWMEVSNLEDSFAYYKLRATTDDSSEIEESNQGNFYLSICNCKLIKPIADMNLVFDNDTSLTEALNFKKRSLNDIYAEKQINLNKIPGGFSGINWVSDKTLKKLII